MKYVAKEYLSDSGTGKFLAEPGQEIKLTSEQAKALLAIHAIEEMI